MMRPLHPSASSIVRYTALAAAGQPCAHAGADAGTHRMKMHSVLSARPKIMDCSFRSRGTRVSAATLAVRPAIGRRVCHRAKNSVAHATYTVMDTNNNFR